MQSELFMGDVVTVTLVLFPDGITSGIVHVRTFDWMLGHSTLIP